VLWEDFLDAMSQTRLQDEYSKAIEESDVFVSLFYSKVGKYTKEEFTKAFGAFHEGGNPLVYTYFKNADIKIGDIKEDQILSLLSFKKELSDLGHFYTTYTSIEDLKYKFGEQLAKILPEV
jgi:hypothetical protein